MSGGKKKKSSSSSSSSGSKSNKKNKETVKDNFIENVEDVSVNVSASGNTEANEKINSTKSPTNSATSAASNDAFAANPSVDVLDRLAPPILFFPPNVAEEYLNRFCPVPQPLNHPSENSLLADEGFPDREIPVMRRLLAMMAGIMSKASAASARTYYSRVAGTEGRRNGYFQQNLNTSVFNLFSTLSAAGNPQAGDSNNNNEKDLHLAPAAAFTAKDGEPLRGYPSRLMKFWRQLSPTEQLRLVKEEHAALTNSWIESRQNWCLCAHCKHRRMTISDLTDCLYQTYCEELEAFLNSGGQGSTLYSPNLTNSMEPAAKARRFLFKSLSVVGEQALLPRYNQFILRLEAFSSMAFSMKDNEKKSNSGHKVKIPSDLKNEIRNGFKSAALQASKEFLQLQRKNATEIEEFMSEKFLPPSENLKRISFENPLEGLNIKLIHGSDEEDCVILNQSSSDSENSGIDDDDDDDDDDEEDRESHQGGIQSEDDDDLIDEETDLPIDESELMLPGGASFPLLPVGDGPVQWSESSRIECGRTVFLMFASEMFQYRLTAAYLAHETKLRQMKLLAEVEEEERLEKEKRAKEEREKKEKIEAEKKKKKAKKEKAAAKASGNTKAKKQQVSVVTKKPVLEPESESEAEKENVNVDVNADVDVDVDNSAVETVESQETVEAESIVAVETVESVEPVDEPQGIHPSSQGIHLSSQDIHPSHPQAQHPSPLLSSPLFPPSHQPPSSEDDDFDPTLLVEQLSKEMNRFELYGGAAEREGEMSPPGFAPPPGFAAAEPKQLGELAGEYGYSARPPFSLDYEGYYGYAPRPQTMQGHMQNHRQGHVYDQSHDHMHAHYRHAQPPSFIPPGYHQHPQPYPYQAHSVYGYPQSYHQTKSQTQSQAHVQSQAQSQAYHPPAAPFPGYYRPEEPSKEGQSRFQSFFSKSIFGPSSFFSQ